MPEKKILFDSDTNTYSFECVHCHLMVQVKKNEIACKIFRHGYFKNNNSQIPPHAPKELCDRLAAEDKIFGCGKPFKFDGQKVEKCGYI